MNLRFHGRERIRESACWAMIGLAVFALTLPEAAWFLQLVLMAVAVFIAASEIRKTREV